MIEFPNERIPCRVFSRASDASVAAAREIAGLIRDKASKGQMCVLGLVAGSTPVNVYDELVRMHRSGEVSFANVISFNLDEYFPMQPFELQSIARFMHEHLFDLVDIQPSNVHIPDGAISKGDVAEYCHQYEQLIHECGGIDIQLLGINRTGHIGLNEPGSDRATRTRMITLDSVTRTDAASDFFGAENVPRYAITMGVGTILEAKRIFLLAFGEGKADIVAKTIEGYANTTIPATFLQDHPDTYFLLTDADYNEQGLQDLLAAHGNAYDINLRVFRHMQSTITGWPGGKPEHAKQVGDRPGHRDDIFPKRIVVFSPHPDDDVISMGGTLIRLVEQGHEVHIAYQTSGNIAVFDEDAIRFAEFVEDFCAEFQIHAPGLEELESHIDDALRKKQPGQVDSHQVQRIKGLIRRGEAREGARCCGVRDEHLHFLDLPFYQTGRVKKSPLSAEDIRITLELLHNVQPHQIYAAGDLSDPHGTHRTCLSAILQACKQCEGNAWYENCAIWLYRGAWQEWPPHQIEMAVPLSPTEVAKKRAAIFKHESQKDRALFPGSDVREFWQRAEQRNADTARRYDEIGLAEYAAIEGFVRWDGQSGIEL